jgi:hypothetical protein
LKPAPKPALRTWRAMAKMNSNKHQEADAVVPIA